MKFLNLLLLAVLTLTACGYVGETPTLTSVRGGNVKLAANTVSSEDTNGNILLDPNGSGNVNLPDLTASLPLKLDGSKNVTSAAISLSGAEVTNTLPANKGGTGAATLTLNNVLLGNGTSAVQFVAPGASGNVLTSDGTTWSSSPASGGTVTGPGVSVDSEVVLFNGTSGNVLKRATGTGVAHLTSGVLSAANVNLASEVTGVNPIANGGTNSSTALSGSSIMISNGSAVIQGAAGTTTTVLHGNAAGAPTYGAVSLTADVSGVTPMANGGTNKNMTASNGSIVYSDADSQELSSVGSSGQVLLSGGAGAPTWSSTPTFTQLDVDNIRLDANTISTTNANGDLEIVPNGTGATHIQSPLSVGTSSDPDASTILDLISTIKGFGLPSMTYTQEQAVSSPREGVAVWNNSGHSLDIWNGTQWVSSIGVISSGMSLAAEMHQAGAASCTGTTVTTGTTPVALTTNAACVAPAIDFQDTTIGTPQTTDANLFEFTINSLKTGKYLATFDFKVTSSSAGDASFAINDGTSTCFPRPGTSGADFNHVIVQCVFSYTTQANRSFELYGVTTAGTLTVSNTNTASGVIFRLERYEEIGAYFQNCTSDAACSDLFSAKVSAAGVVSNENVNYITGNASISSTSVYDFTFESIFSQAPNCVAISADAAGTTRWQRVTSTSTTMEVEMHNGSGTHTATPFTVLCQRGDGDYVAKRQIVATFKGVATTSTMDRPVLASAEVDATEVVSGEDPDFITTCTNADPSVCTFVSSYWAATPKCWADPRTAGEVASVTTASTTSVTIDRTSAATPFGLFCHGNKTP